MKLTPSFLCLLGLSVLCFETLTALPTFPNIEYLSHGYDLVKANPSANQVDPGWRKYQPVLSLSYDDGNTYDGMYAVPDQSNVLDTPSCSYQGESFVLQTAEQYVCSFPLAAVSRTLLCLPVWFPGTSLL